MAKKTFDISSTLNKNKDTAQLASKIPLKKTEKDTEEVREKVDLIHSAPEPESVKTKPVTVAKADKATKVKASAKAAQMPDVPKLVRLTIDTPEEMHKKLKIKSIEKGISMRDYILLLLEKELK